MKSKSCRNCGNFQLGYGFGYKSKSKKSGPQIYEQCIFKENIIKQCKKNNFNLWIEKD